MILSEYDRRWAEIRLYQFCVDVYKIRQQSIDIFECVNIICDLGNIDPNEIKTIIRLMLGDTYYQATKREIIMIGTVKGLAANNMAKYLDMSRQGITQFIERNKDMFTPLPRLSIDDDQLIIKFLKTLDKLKDIGRLGYGTAYKGTV
ncbi:MAG: hypothetical protein J6Z28_07360 [Succinivibrio sp.]|nr:hypothetical protein [Succinivibrio sp.]